MEGSSDASKQSTSVGPERANNATHFAEIVDLLITIGYIDGVFHPREQAFVQQYIDSVIVLIEELASADEAASFRAAWRGYFDELYPRLDAEIGKLSDEEEPLRKRALTLYGNLPPQEQETAIELIHALIHANAMVTPSEHRIWQDLTCFEPTPATSAPTAKMQALVDSGPPPPAASAKAPMIINEPVWLELAALSDPVLDPLEQTYSPHPVERKSQVEWDYRLIRRAIAQWQKQRALGTGRLAGLSFVDQLPTGSRFLDGRVYVMKPNQPVELVVLGDIHGCYSCLKAALLQTNFVQRVWAHQWDPQRYPDVKLVLLGDYIDRGLFSFDGVLRAVLQLFVSMPDNVFVLRGNHEYLKWDNNRIISGVYPAEALASITPHVPIEMLDAYRILFEHMPTSLICDDTFFVHAGIPRDDTFAARYRDLSSLNDAEMCFQMMWSDPVQSTHVPVEIQQQNPRFSFGYDQFRAFMERTGFRTMIRGHEKIESGFEVVYNMGEQMLLNLFSAGGEKNHDLPKDSSYRKVRPMGLTLQYGNGTPTATPWPLLYQSFNYPPHNGLYRPHPVLTFRYL